MTEASACGTRRVRSVRELCWFPAVLDVLLDSLRTKCYFRVSARLMKLAFKLILATVIGILAVFAVFGFVRRQREVAMFDSDMRKYHRLIGTTLGLCVENTWVAAGSELAIELVTLSDADRPDLRIGWIQPDGTVRARVPVLSSEDGSDLSEIDHQVLSSPDNSSQTFLVTRIPVRLDQTLLGVIEIAEDLEARDAYLLSSIWSTLTATVVMVLVAGVVVLVLGVWLVGGPLKAVADKARRIGHGDLSRPLKLRQKDEIGQLANEVDAMCERITEANARSDAETAARLQATEQLRHADRLITVGRLAAGIAHELGTPLNIINGRIKMLRRGSLEPNLVTEYLEESAGQVDLMTSIIRQLVNFARRREPRTTSTDLEVIAKSITRLVEPLARKRGVAVTVSNDQPVIALVDPMQMEQVLSNLVINAIHACRENGHVEVSFGAQPAPASGIFLRVSDDGQGMDNSTMERVFEPFFTTKDIGQGTGLGLSVAHGIVQDHGGRITVASELGRGSEFTVLLPAVVS